MTSEAEIVASTSRPGIAPARTVCWLLGSLLAAGLLAAVLSQVPQEIRKLGLFAGLCGLATGSWVGYWGRDCKIGRRRMVLTWAAALAMAVFAQVTWISFLAYERQAAAALKKSPEALMAVQMVEQLDSDESMRQSIRERYAPRFRDYLSSRVSPLGHWSAPVPELFWTGELVIAALCGWWSARRFWGFAARNTLRAPD